MRDEEPPEPRPRSGLPPMGWETHLEAHNTGPGRINQAARDQHFHYYDGTHERRHTASDGLAGQCPYPGLPAFRPEDARWFFGREDLAAELIDCLDQRCASGGVQLVIGPSGAGKSSLLGAGLIPRLEHSALPGSSQWPVAFFTPTAEPLAALAGYIASQTGDDEATLAESLTASPDTCLDEVILKLRTWLHDVSPGARFVIIVDQFEELFTLCAEQSQRRTFIDFLIRAADAPQDGLSGGGPLALVVLSVRADFYPDLTKRPELRSALQDAPLVVGSMSETELREAIIFPARDVGLDLEPGLVDVVLSDLGALSEPSPDASDFYEAGRLPLLAHALRATWRQRHGSTMTVEGYRSTRGIQRAIAATADKVFADLDDEKQLLAQVMFLRLIKVGLDSADTRRVMPRAELLRTFGNSLAAKEVMDAFTKARLLTQELESVQITHDALLRSWPRLGEWLDADRAGQLIRQSIEEAASAWGRDRQESSRLFRGSVLKDAVAWAVVGANTQGGVAGNRKGAARYRAVLTPAGARFLDVSVSHERRNRLIRRVLFASVAALVATALVAGVLLWRANLENEQQKHTQASHLLGRASRDEADPLRALQFALAAWHNDNSTQEARDALLRQYLAMGSVSGVEYDYFAGNKVKGWATSADGHTAVIATLTPAGDTNLTLNTGLFGPTPASRVIATASRLGNYLISPDGELVVFADEKGVLNLWRDGRIDQLVVKGSETPYRMVADYVRFSPDGRFLLLRNGPHADINPRLPTVLTVIDLAEREVVFNRELDVEGGYDVAFGARSDTLVSVMNADFNSYPRRTPQSGEIVRLPTGAKTGATPAGAFLTRGGSGMLTCEEGVGLRLFDSAGAVTRTIDHPFCDEVRLDRTGRYLLRCAEQQEPPENYQICEALDLETGKRYVFRAPLDPETAWFSLAASLDQDSRDLSILMPMGTSLLTLRAIEVSTLLLVPGTRDPTGRYVLQVDSERSQLVSVRDGALLGSQSGDFLEAGFTADGEHILALRGTSVAVYETRTFAEEHTIDLPAGAPDSTGGRVFLFSPQDSELLLICDGFLYRWDAETGAAINAPLAIGRTSDTALLVPGKPHKVAIVRGDTLTVWDVELRRILKVISLGMEIAKTDISEAVVDSSGSRIAIHLADERLHVWNINTGKKEFTSTSESSGNITGFDSQGMVVVGGPYVITVWDLVRRMVLGPVGIPANLGPEPVLDVGQDSLDIETSGAVLTIPLVPDVWFAELCRAANRPLAPDEVAKVPAGGLTDPPCG